MTSSWRCGLALSLARRLAAHRLERLAHQLLVGVRAVDRGGVEEREPRSSAVRISEIIACLPAGGPKPKLIPMQPRPMAETSRLLLPGLRFCIV
jgi:hypothetical protein